MVPADDAPDAGEVPPALAKVRKLLALATSPNPHEAALAAARAQALVDRHRLEAWLAAERDVRDDPDPIVDARDAPLEHGRRVRKWKLALASALAHANGCVAYLRTTPDGEAIVLVGRGRDRQLVEELWQWLVRRIEWLSATHGAGRPRRWHEGFRVGVVEAVAASLVEVERAQAASTSAEALAVIEPQRAAERAALDAFVAANLGLGRGAPLRVDAAAYRRGRVAAAELTAGGLRRRKQ